MTYDEALEMCDSAVRTKAGKIGQLIIVNKEQAGVQFPGDDDVKWFSYSEIEPGSNAGLILSHIGTQRKTANPTTHEDRKMPTYEITGTNQAGNHGTWEIEADDEKALDRIISERGLQAEKINGETVKRSRPKHGASGENDSDGANTVR